MKSFRVLHGKHRQLPDIGEYFLNMTSPSRSVYISSGSPSRIRGPASYFFGNNDSSEIVYTSDNTGSFHFYDTFLCFFRGSKRAPFLDLHMM